MELNSNNNSSCLKFLYLFPPLSHFPYIAHILEGFYYFCGYNESRLGEQISLKYTDELRCGLNSSIKFCGLKNIQHLIKSSFIFRLEKYIKLRPFAFSACFLNGGEKKTILISAT